jgi:pimeloyl-ACP methyl ester carboxylesterase
MLETTLETHGDGRRLRVARLGAGPPVILLHGYPDTLQIWCELAPRLADRQQVIAFDWPGMGESDAWKGGASPTHMAERLVRLLDAWGIERADLVGLDMGGQPALVAAAEWPARIRRLCVMNSLALWDEATSWEIRILRQYGWNRLVLRHLPSAVFVRALWTFLPRGVRLSRDLRGDFWRSFRRTEVRRYIVRMCGAYSGSLRRLPEQFARIACPTLVLWGGHDRHFPPAHATRLHAAVPGSRLSVLPGAEHWMAWYLADRVAAEIRTFADAHP